MFLAVSDLTPQLLPFVISAYVSPSSLFFGDRVIESREGVQQGDPLSPALSGKEYSKVIPWPNIVKGRSTIW